MVIFNASGNEQTWQVAELKGLPFELHPIQAASDDPVLKIARYDAGTGSFLVPARTTAVFVVKAKDVAQAVPTVAPITAPAPQPPIEPPTAMPAPTSVPTAQPAVAESTSSPVVPIVVGGVIALVALVGVFIYRQRSK